MKAAFSYNYGTYVGCDYVYYSFSLVQITAETDQNKV